MILPKQSLFTRVKGFLANIFESEAERRRKDEAWRVIEPKPHEPLFYVPPPPLYDEEAALRTFDWEPSARGVAATNHTWYADHLARGVIGLPWGSTAHLEDTVLCWGRIRRLLGSGESQRSHMRLILMARDASRAVERLCGQVGLDPGAIDLEVASAHYERALELDGTASILARRGHWLYQSLAEEVLGKCLIWPIYGPRPTSTFLADRMRDDELVEHRGLRFGIRPRDSEPEHLGPELAEEAAWLFRQARTDYIDALELDPTLVRAHVHLSQVLRVFGEDRKAIEHIDRALTILNRAIRADSTDEESYRKRAEILEGLGELGAAIADLEQVLTLSTDEWDVRSTRRKLEELRKRLERASQRPSGGDR